MADEEAEADPAISTLIIEMKAVKADNPILEISDVLRIFNIQAMRDLTQEVNIARRKW